MPDLTLPAFHITKRTRLAVEADHPLTKDLERYVAFYRQTHHATVTPADLVREMARQFMIADPAFQQFKNPSSRKRHRPSRAKPTSPPERPPEVSSESVSGSPPPSS
ncbi:MAG: DUF2274 domain-containing protein [Planctomycetota bacterium]